MSCLILHAYSESPCIGQYMVGAKGDWDFWISDLAKNPDGTHNLFNRCGEFR